LLVVYLGVFVFPPITLATHCQTVLFIRGCDYVSPSSCSRIILLVAATGCQKMMIFSLRICAYELLTYVWSVLSKKFLLSTVYQNYVVSDM